MYKCEKRLNSSNHFTLTAVPCAKISEAPCMTAAVVNRTLTTASAPIRSASAIMRSMACSRACAISLVYSAISPPAMSFKPAMMSRPNGAAAYHNEHFDDFPSGNGISSCYHHGKNNELVIFTIFDQIDPFFSLFGL